MERSVKILKDTGSFSGSYQSILISIFPLCTAFLFWIMEMDQKERFSWSEKEELEESRKKDEFEQGVCDMGKKCPEMELGTVWRIVRWWSGVGHLCRLPAGHDAGPTPLGWSLEGGWAWVVLALNQWFSSLQVLQSHLDILEMQILGTNTGDLIEDVDGAWGIGIFLSRRISFPGDFHARPGLRTTTGLDYVALGKRESRLL